MKPGALRQAGPSRSPGRYRMTFAEWIAAAHPYLERFDYDRYPACFDAFEQELAACLAPFAGQDPAQSVPVILAQFESRWATLTRKAQREEQEKDKRVLALFFTPAAVRRGGEAEALAEALCCGWIARYPRNPYTVGDFDTIMKGFDANLLGLPLRKSRQR